MQDSAIQCIFADKMEGKVKTHTAISTIFNDVRTIIENGLHKAYQDVNVTTVYTYWQVGRRIVEEEQQGERRAEYGSKLITTLAEVLSMEYAQGFSARDLRNYRQLYLCFKDLDIWYTRVPNLKGHIIEHCFLSRAMMPDTGM